MAFNMALRAAMASRQGAAVAHMLKNKTAVMKEYEAKERAAFQKASETTNPRLVLPQLQFFITDQCTLACKDCNAFIPDLKKSGKNPWRMRPEELRNNLRILENAVKTIRHCMFLGGEPLLHPQLAELLEIAVSSPLIEKLEITTNGTVIPNANVIETLTRHKDKIYIRASDYTVAPIAPEKFHFEELANVCKNIGIEFLRVASPWTLQTGHTKSLNPQEARQVFKNCRFQNCAQVYDNSITVCPKACSGYILGRLDMTGETVDLRTADNLFERLVEFYSAECFDACATCPLTDTEAPVAAQAWPV